MTSLVIIIQCLCIAIQVNICTQTDMSHHIIEFDIRYECTRTYVLFIETVNIWVKTGQVTTRVMQKIRNLYGSGSNSNKAIVFK